MVDKGKNDLDRVGIFKEMEYVSIGDPYKRPDHHFNASASKGKQMLPGGSKERSALQAGYFSEKYNRVFDGEAYSDPIKRRRQHRISESKKNITTRAFMPSNAEKTVNGLGSTFGTFGGVVTHFEPNSRPGKSAKKPGRNVITNPGKRGTGFGYASVAFSSYPKYASETYDKHRQLNKKANETHKQKMKGPAFKLNMHPRSYFDSNPFGSDKPAPPARKSASARPVEKPFKPSSPSKRPGGCKAGTFETYPTHSTDPYVVRRQRTVNVVNKFGKTFYPSQGPKSTPQVSVINHNVTRTINRQNFRTMRSVTCL